MRGRFGALLLVAALRATSVEAQQVPVPSESPILTLDQERLFATSAWGKKALAEIDAATTTLAAENRRIEAELTAQERALTDQRPTMSSQDFRVAADAFDKKVVEIRRTQDGKERELTALRDTARQQFFAAALPEIREMMRERGALAVMDARAVLIASASIDMTDDLIERLDQTIGAGPPVTSPKPSEPPVQPTPDP